MSLNLVSLQRLDEQNQASHLRLGASLYIPATRPDLISIASGVKFPALKSVILDTEDAIKAEELPQAYHNIRQLLASTALERPASERNILIFIRTRNPQELHRLNELPGIERIDGFVLPKFCTENMADYLDVPLSANHFLMPILEKNVFDIANIVDIRNFLLPHRNKVLSLRIGATDLLSNLGLRRSSNATIYEIGALQKVITDIVITFKPYDFNITAPVWESFNEQSRAMLKKEVELDLLNGLFGKSIIHPWQIDIVQEAYQVERRDFEIANKLVEEECPAVFNLYETMHEKTTHHNWAKNILERARIYGLRDTDTEDDGEKESRWEK